MRIFLLTKSPQSERTRLCLQLIARSPDAVVYLAGDAVYNLIGDGESLAIGPANQASQAGQALTAAPLPAHRIFACREDLQARGVCPDGKAVVLDDFYDRLVQDIMKDGSRVYSF
jgi:tRNA 2-thiouridine synthesizing protein B